MKIDGRAIAASLLKEVKESLSRELVVRAVVVAPSPATESYLAIKTARAKDAGMRLEVVRLMDTATTDEVIAAVQEPGADAVIVQLPLPSDIDRMSVLNSIPVSLDADVLSHPARILFEEGAEGALLPPVVGAVKEILERENVSLKGVKTAVVGDGWLVGDPVARWFKQQGADVTVITQESESTVESLKEAMVVVTGVGSPHLITPELLTEGVVLIDAGTSESGGAIAGDADPACETVASVFTPVPGGVGPIAVASLFKNVALLAKR